MHLGIAEKQSVSICAATIFSGHSKRCISIRGNSKKGNVFPIETSIGTFEFDKALNEGFGTDFKLVSGTIQKLAGQLA